MNYYPVTDGQTDGRTESDAYEPTVQYAQVGSKMKYKYNSSVKGKDDQRSINREIYWTPGPFLNIPINLINDNVRVSHLKRQANLNT